MAGYLEAAQNIFQQADATHNNLADATGSQNNEAKTLCWFPLPEEFHQGWM